MNFGKRLIRALLPASKLDLDKIESKLMDLKAALVAIATATDKIASNVAAEAATLQTQANVIQTISDEMDALELNLKNSGVPQVLIDQANALATRAQAACDALDGQVTTLNAQVPVLQGIASKGAADPVPVPVPDPTPAPAPEPTPPPEPTPAGP